jgi:hypothetical protein
MEKTFNTSFEGLSDSVGWNDSSSFRLLAKILACMEVLEHDALIALSCQFSKVTEEEEEECAEVSVEDQVGEEITEEFAVDEAAPVNEEATAPEKSSQEVAVSTPGDAHTETPIHLTETTITSKTVEDGVLKDSTTVIIEEASVETAQEVDAAEDDAQTEVPKGPYDDEETVQPTVPDSEELSSAGLGCDGPCGRSWNKWEVPVYFCLLCTNCDLCPTCYGKRMAQNRGETTNYWKPYCGKNHRYAKGPIKGWQGVKGGSFSILSEDGTLEEVKVQDWLKGLKEERWPAAWKRFWTKLEGVKDLGF